ncbi:hypothetical protein T4D_6910 [Trichinella pseudospiralis]|uniref:FLYWCH-type domain-containing protein n=1 Tax=Trichinella pseudospiralis TaxID=6337 RepID=A0A0V1FZQ8_TRIPS|nr:hypothetical protein T4D_6910 [Trichinella pseudospiralis]
MEFKNVKFIFLFFLLCSVLHVRQFYLMENDEIQFVSTQRNQQKLVYRGRCYTLKRTNRNDKCWTCARKTCRGTLWTNVEATRVIRISEHAESCRVDAHAFNKHHQLDELKRLAAEDPRPVTQIYHELARSADNFPTWGQARHIMYYSRARRFLRLPETRQELQPTVEEKATNAAVLHLEAHKLQQQMLDLRISKQNCFNGMRGCPGKLYTNLDATEQLLNELKRLAAEYLRPVSEIYDELASNASNNLDTAVYFSSWDQARNTKYYSRAKRYPRLLARRQDLRLTAEQTTTKSGAQFLIRPMINFYHRGWCEAAGAGDWLTAG